MDSIDNKGCGLQWAKQVIQEHLRVLPHERIELEEARNRISIADITADEPVPTFTESTRDGFVISSADRGSGGRRYKIVDEIAAGRVHRVGRLVAGTACRIMTGGCVPDGSERIVPYEQCIELDGEVLIAEHLLQVPATFIRKAGSEIASGETLVQGGVRLRAEHLELLSSCGIRSVTVSTRPAVGYFCTGSELKTSTVELKNGQKVSSNSFLLAGILASFGAIPRDFGIVGDTSQELLHVFAKAGEWDGDVIISTGGMGPGKYDLVEKAFVAAGGTVIFNALAVRPGKSILFGRLGRVLFFGLPGPPHAVRTLLHALAGPALLAMQGARDAGPKKVQAHLRHLVEVKHHNVLQLRDGILSFEEGRCSVRFTERLEVANCHILLHPGCARLAEGELVDVHLLADFFQTFSP